jgi:hypothetical protein
MGAQRAHSERRVSFVGAVEVRHVAGNTALKREAARAKRVLAEAAARREAKAEADHLASRDRARGGAWSGAMAARDDGRSWAAAERDALRTLADESPSPDPLPLSGGADSAAHGARRERRVAHGSTKRDGPTGGRGEAADAPWRAPRGTAWAEVLVVFAGEGGDRDLPACLRARGMSVTAVDTKQGGARHDACRAARSATRCCGACVGASSTWSSSPRRARHTQLRTDRSPLRLGLTRPSSAVSPSA